MPDLRFAALIPARMASTRLPGKPLRLIAGVPMIERVYRRAAACAGLASVAVATEDDEIVAFCRSRSIPVEKTGPHPSGTDRLAELAPRISADVIVNLQGDEPLLDPRQVASLLAVFSKHPEARVATIVAPLAPASLDDPSKVKVAVTPDDRALYFSRAPIPFDRDGSGLARWQHVGLYAFTRDALAAFARRGESPLERAERLEQLRFLEAGIPIHVGYCDAATRAVDTEADLAAVERLLER